MTFGDSLAGRLDRLVVDSQLLRSNPLGDPHERPLWVYVPPGYDDEPDRRYPSVYVLQGYGDQLAAWHNFRAYRPTFPQAIDRMFAAEESPPAIVVFVDGWSRYGGSQFVDSAGTGRYHSYLCDEIVPFVDDRFRTMAHADHRGISGHSSGGFGAMITAMLRPDLFRAFASHAGDALYEHLYLPEFAKSVRYLRDYDGDIWNWWTDFRSRPAFSREADETLLMTLGCAACFSPGADGRPELPFDPTTGAPREEVWQRWLDWDPVRMAPHHTEALTAQRAVWIDAGTSDEYLLDLGAAAFRDRLIAAGVSPATVHFELFEGGHGGIDHRYPLALRWLIERIGT